MSRAIPMVALRTFVKVCRYGSMKRAGESLCISLGAVSQQIKGLESRIGKRLFQRDVHGLQLTSSGLALYEKLAEPMDGIEGCWAAVSGELPGRARLVLSTTSSVASSWLIPRLADFHARWPDIEVSVEVSARLADLRHGHVDVALMYDQGDYAGHSVTPLWYSRLIPVCSPALLVNGPRIEQPQDCLAYPLLQDSDRLNWKLWLGARGCIDKRALRGTSFCDESLLIGAACAGQGIALVSDVLVAREVATGKLVQAIDVAWPAKGYHLVIARERIDEWAIRAFRDWMVQHATDAAHRPHAVRYEAHRPVAPFFDSKINIMRFLPETDLNPSPRDAGKASALDNSPRKGRA
ncbi:LysR substrate-binding domain-containing protein [Massilia sp. erpn]|uniref:LysR substrate-binding domain-containing protein n=1 Tax=Massilia sp. erpn TaxID=2738142 RepID=UPI0021031E6D|nr:LysR substrate-binding domain-containing protein [Massilia sp. erpn]UTY58947.1 LysR family transcriptional regulator [Massilia sp. erpn]